MKNKRGMSAWIWILIILILISVGVGIYLWLSGGAGSIIGGVPKPPALPSG